MLAADQECCECNTNKGNDDDEKSKVITPKPDFPLQYQRSDVGTAQLLSSVFLVVKPSKIMFLT